MSKKRSGKSEKRTGRKLLCERCGQVARASVKVTSSPSWVHKAGTLGLPRAGEAPHRPLSFEEAFQCAREAGIIDEDGNLMPRYQ